MMTRGGKISEKDLSTYVEELLNQYGWRWTHFRPAMERSGKWLTALSGHKGFPDYVAVRDGILLFAELKAEKGELTKDQFEWMRELSIVRDLLYASYNETVSVLVYTWRPSDMERIKEVLE